MIISKYSERLYSSRSKRKQIKEKKKKKNKKETRRKNEIGMTLLKQS